MIVNRQKQRADVMDERENKIKYRQAFSKLAVPDDMADRIMASLGDDKNAVDSAEDKAALNVVPLERRTAEKQSAKKRYRMAV